MDSLTYVADLDQVEDWEETGPVSGADAFDESEKKKKNSVDELTSFFLDLFFRTGILNTLLAKHTHLHKLLLVLKNHYPPHGGIMLQSLWKKATPCLKSTTTSEASLLQTYLNATKLAVPI
jgi:hypothetical protein